MKKKRILIIGATGFIGANLAHRLAGKPGLEIYATVRKGSNLWRISGIKKSLHFVECEISDYAQVKSAVEKVNPDVIYHCAAYGAVYGESDFNNTISTNLIGTINLINACRGRKIEAFINLGSSSEYGIKKKPMKESDVLNPNTDYGISKAAGTEYASMIARLYKMPIVTIRPFSPFGYYESKNRLIPSLILSIINGNEPNLANPRSARDFIFIDDLIDLMLEAAGKAEKYRGEVFNAANGKQRTVKEIAEISIKASGKKLKPHFNMLPGRAYDTNIWVADMGKTFSAFKWRPKRRIENAIKILILWFKKNQKFYN